MHIPYVPRLQVGTIIRFDYEQQHGYRVIQAIDDAWAGHGKVYVLKPCTKTGKLFPKEHNEDRMSCSYVDIHCPVIREIPDSPIEVDQNIAAGVRKRRIAYLQQRITSDTMELAKLEAEEASS